MTGRPERSAAFWVFTSFLLIYIGLTRGHFWTSDEIQVFRQTESLVTRGNLAVSPTPMFNALPGRDGEFYAPYAAGQSVLSIPLYELGAFVHNLLERAHANTWIESFEGRPGSWLEGTVENFFVNLFNAIAGAALMTVFFVFSCRLGAKPLWALAATATLGLATNLTGLTTGYFQHVAEALFALLSFDLLHRDRLTPSLRTRSLAGLAVCAMLTVRPSTLVFLPALLAYLAWNSWRRNKHQAWRVMLDALPVLAGCATGYLLDSAVNYWEFGVFSFSGSYAYLVPFNTPWTTGLYGFLYSPGESVFLFSPPLLLAPWWIRNFLRTRPAETAVLLGMTLAYLALYSRAYMWHGQWCFGPRYLAATLPLLLLPLGCWLDDIKPAARLWLTPVLLAGLLVSALYVFVNIGLVYIHEGYRSDPQFSFLYSFRSSQIPAHLRALLAGDDRLDFWLLNVFRKQGGIRFATFFLPLAGAFAFSVVQLERRLRDAPAVQGAGC